MLALANLAGGATAYLAVLHAESSAEVIVHQAVAERTLRFRTEITEAQHKHLAAHVGNAVGRIMAKVFGG